MKKFLLAYFLFLLSVFTLLSGGVIDSHDGFLYTAVARNIYYTGEATGPPDEYNTRQNIPMSVGIGPNGKTYSPTGLGFSLAFLPAAAITDIFYKIYHITPPQHYPLDSDWLILFFSSFTNNFFGAVLGLILFIYFSTLNLNKRQALLMSLLALFSTNLLAYSKHTFAQMMFLTFLTLSFLLLKLYINSKQKLLLFLSGISFGIHLITYNMTFILSIVPLASYYLSLTWIRNNFSLTVIRSLLKDFLIFFAATVPFLLLFFNHNNRGATATGLSQVSPSPFTDSLLVYIYSQLSNFPITVFFEAVWGQLFSPGRSFFLYSPILVIILIFWFKLKSKTRPELISFLTLFFIYIAAYATFYQKDINGIAPTWTGESSWGPRYLTPVIPFGMLLVGSIYQQLSKGSKYFIFYPLAALGIFIEILGIVQPYQIKYHDTESSFKVNGTKYTNYLYTNLLPRYSPLINMSKKLVKSALFFPSTFQHGFYNVRFIDGFNPPFNVGPERWRTIRGKGYVVLDNNHKDSIKFIKVGLINQPIAEASYSARINFTLNGYHLLSTPEALKLSERKQLTIPIKTEYLLDKDNQLVIEVDYGENNPKEGSQILALLYLFINDRVANTESLDFPYYMGGLGPPMADAKYTIFGGEIKDPWEFWEIHTQLYERLPDLWWIRNLYYWDIPKSFIIGLLIFNIVSLLTLSVLLYRYFKKLPKNILKLKQR